MLGSEPSCPGSNPGFPANLYKIHDNKCIMQELLQHDDLFDLVIAKKKFATVCKGCRDINLGPLTIKGTDTGRETQVSVHAVEFIQLHDLNQAHAEIDGYESVDALRDRLAEIYGDLEPSQEMTVVYWK